jgi:hypothetical protein
MSWTVKVTVAPDASLEALLQVWLYDVQVEQKASSTWAQISRNMDRHAAKYERLMGSGRPASPPWRQDVPVEFCDPQFSSLIAKPRDSDTNAGSGASSGTGGDSSAPTPDTDGSNGPSDTSAFSGSLIEGHHAAPYTTSTRKAAGKIDIVLEVCGFCESVPVDSRISEAELHRIAGRESHQDLI